MTKPEVVALSPNCSAVLQAPGGWFLNNAGWVTGSQGTVLVDTAATEQRCRSLLRMAHAANRTGTVLTVVITHAHGDHAHGAGLAAQAGATVWATSSAREEILSGPHTFPELFDCPHWGEIPPPHDIAPVTHDMTIDLGDAQVQVIPVPDIAHTTGDLVVWAPDQRVLFAGDLVFSGVVPLAISGSIRGWLAALDWLDTFDASCLVPGHGPISWAPQGAIHAVREYLQWLQTTVTSLDVADIHEASQQAHERFAGWHDPERHTANLHLAHAEAHGQRCSFTTLARSLTTATGGLISLDLGL